MQDNARSESAKESDVPPNGGLADNLDVDSGANGGTLDASHYALRLRDVYRNLQKANQTIGYLEARLQRYRARLHSSPDAEEKIERLRQIEPQNEGISELEQTARLVDALSRQNDELRETLRSSETTCMPWWSSIKDVLINIEAGRAGERSKPYKMQDYYEMIQHHLSS